jgi:ribosomal protein S18 acetylase RimI-like enzyme
MTVLTPMTPAGFAAYLQSSIVGYAEDNVAAGRWPADAALERSRQEFETLLPNGLATPDNHLFDIREGPGDDSTVVGFLWFAIEAPRGLRSAADSAAVSAAVSAFVYDVGIDPAWQRRGHATRAFVALEGLVRALGAQRIGLHVFGHNSGAQALYARLGYGVTGLNMLKPLAP